MRLTFHIVSLPHTETTSEYLSCAYTQKVIKFCKMMKSLGHEVMLYGSEKNDAPCDKFISCSKAMPSDQYANAPFDMNHPNWVNMNESVIGNMRQIIGEKDFICLIGGICQKPIADAFPANMSVEFGIGYSGVFSNYKVFESYAWMHTVYGDMYKSYAANGNFYDRVIPNYFDVDDFPFSNEKDDYFLYIGRLIDRKGYSIAEQVCKHLGKRLIVAGSGDLPKYGEYVGTVDAKRRGELMSRAKAVFVPTLYLEPFGGVAAEAMLCGTPVITTDWGAFSEYNVNGVTGFRCRLLRDFIEAANRCYDGELDYEYIKYYAQSQWSMDVIKYEYEKYFYDLMTLWGDGWNTINK